MMRQWCHLFVFIWCLQAADVSVLDADTIRAAVSLSKFAYTENPHNIPPLVAVEGIPQSMQRPLAMVANGIHAYLFKEQAGPRCFVAIRGTVPHSLQDLVEDFRWFGGSTHQYLPLNALKLAQINVLYNSNRDSCARRSTLAPTSTLTDISNFITGDYNETSLTYFVEGLRFVRKARQYLQLHHDQQECDFVFVGHSLGGAIASLLAVAFDATAVVFNAPGALLASSRMCEQAGFVPMTALPPESVERLCTVQPNHPSVFNIYFEADIVPQILDYQIGQVCPISLSMVASDIDLIRDDVRRVGLLGGLLNVNFPEGIISCEPFTQVERLSDLLSLSFLECFGAAHHVQVVYKMLTATPHLAEQVLGRCQPFFSDTAFELNATRVESTNTTIQKLQRLFPALTEEFHHSAWFGALGVLWRARCLTNMFNFSTKIFRLVRHSPIIFLVILIPGWWARRRRKARWAQRELRDRVSIILVTVQEPEIGVRVLRETLLDHLYFNDQITISLILKAAKRTTVACPILGAPIRPEDYFMIKNPILSALYEQFGHGWLASDMGLPIYSQWYYFAVTAVKRENAREKAEKVRVYLVREDTLKTLPRIEDMDFRDSKSLADAFKAVQAMQDLMLTTNDTAQNTPTPKHGYLTHYQLRRIQLALPIAVSHQQSKPTAAQTPNPSHTGEAMRDRSASLLSNTGASLRRIPSLNDTCGQSMEELCWAPSAHGASETGGVGEVEARPLVESGGGGLRARGRRHSHGLFSLDSDMQSDAEPD